MVVKSKPRRNRWMAVTDQLHQLGFSAYEARVYLQLLTDSPATAYEISKAANVPRPNTYSALGSLAERGAVLLVNESPARYVPAPPDALFDTIARSTRNLCEELTRTLEDLPAGAGNDYVWIVHGEDAVHERIEVLLDAAKGQTWIKAADAVLRRHKAALRRAAERGVTNWIVIFGTDPSEFIFTKRCRVFVHEAEGLRMGIADNLFTLAVDNEEMLTANVDAHVTAACTRNRLMVTMASSLIRHDYYMAEIFRKFRREIDAAFGPHLRDLRLPSFTPEQIDAFRQRTKAK